MGRRGERDSERERYGCFVMMESYERLFGAYSGLLSRCI